jgi:hypothetical protein
VTRRPTTSGDARRDHLIRELMRSPLDDTPRRRISPIVMAAAGVLAAIVLIGVPILLFGGGQEETGNDGASEASEPGSSGTEVDGASERSTAAVTTTTLPGVVGYPEARAFAQMETVEPGRMVMIGGVEITRSMQGGTLFEETWVYDVTSDTWRDVTGGIMFEPRHGSAVAYDTRSEVLVLFGGGASSPRWCGTGPMCASPALDDTWIYDPHTNSWTEAELPAFPPGRFGHAMAYDAVGDRVVMFGGARMIDDLSAEGLDDTWVYDADSGVWEQRSPQNSPSARFGHAMTYDAASGRVILWGGWAFGRADLDPAVWAYDLEADTWTEIPAQEGPSPVWDPVLVYDAAREEVVLIGGRGPLTREIAEGVEATEIAPSAQVWAFNVAAERWERRGDLLGGVTGHDAAYDPESATIVMSVYGATFLYEPATDSWTDRTPDAGSGS